MFILIDSRTAKKIAAEIKVAVPNANIYIEDASLAHVVWPTLQWHDEETSPDFAGDFFFTHWQAQPPSTQPPRPVFCPN